MKKKAIKYFREDINCAQSVVASLSEEFGIDLNLFLKIAAGFGGGLGKKQLTCGALTGAIMILGCQFYDPESHDESKPDAYTETRKLFDAFEKEFNCTTCRELLGVNFNTPEGKAIMEKKDYRHTKCEKYISFVIDYLQTKITSETIS